MRRFKRGIQAQKLLYIHDGVEAAGVLRLKNSVAINARMATAR
jgi:hypothetical protein